MKTKITCILFLAFCLSLVGSSSGEIFIGNAEFEDWPVEPGAYTYAIAPWQWADQTGLWETFVGYGLYGWEPEPITPILFTYGCNVFQVLSATYVEGAPYKYSLDLGVQYETDDWEFWLYDASAGDYLTPLVSRASTDPGEAQIDPLTWYRKSLTFVATSAEAGHQIGVGVSGWEWTIIDNVVLEILAGAYLPDPYDGEINVLLNKTLSWYAARDPGDPSSPNPALTEHKVYMSSGNPTDPNLYYEASIPATGNTAQYTPAVELDREATYYWRVDEIVSDANVVTGDVWMFKTVGTIPFIDDATPAYAPVDAGDDAVFTVVAFNPFTISSDDLSFQWYKVGEPDEMLIDGADYSGSQAESLTVLDAQVADNDEGQYYCVVTNTAGNTESNTSRSATLVIKQFVGHWPFNQNADDIVGGNHGTVNRRIDYVEGIVDAYAVEFSNRGGIGGVDISAVPYTTPSWTISFWEKPSLEDASEEEVLIGSGATFGYDVLDLGLWTGQIFYLGLNGTYVYSDLADAYPRGVWNMVTLTYDHQANQATLYINTLSLIELSVVFPGFDPVLTLGDVSGYEYYGAIDDLRFYNYALDQLEVFLLYADVTGETLCPQNPEADVSGPEGEPDCEVNIYDLVEVVANWLECNRVPVERCL